MQFVSRILYQPPFLINSLHFLCQIKLQDRLTALKLRMIASFRILSR